MPLDPFRELAFVMAIGILLDAIVVRSLLILSLLTLVGTVSGWPGARLLQERRAPADRPAGPAPDRVRLPGPAPAARPALVPSIDPPDRQRNRPVRRPGTTTAAANGETTSRIAVPFAVAAGAFMIVMGLLWWRGAATRRGRLASPRR